MWFLGERSLVHTLPCQQHFYLSWSNDMQYSDDSPRTVAGGWACQEVLQQNNNKIWLYKHNDSFYATHLAAFCGFLYMCVRARVCVRACTHTFLNVNQVPFTCETTSFHSSYRTQIPSHFQSQYVQLQHSAAVYNFNKALSMLMNGVFLQTMAGSDVE